MLKRLNLRNFKSWPEADVKFGKITGLFGPNSSGKSSLLQFLLLLKQTKDSTDRAATLDLNGRFVELGAPTDVVHGHDEKRRISFTLGFDHNAALQIHDALNPERGPVADSSELAVCAIIGIQGGAFESLALAYKVGDAEFALKRVRGSYIEFELAADVPGADFSFVPNLDLRGDPWKLFGPVKTYQFPGAARFAFQNAGFLVELEAAFEIMLDKFHYLGPLREFPKRDYLWARSRPADVGERGERTIDAIIAAQEAGETQNLKRRGRRKPFSGIVAHWLRELGLIDGFRVGRLAPGSNRWQAKVRTGEGATEVMLADAGFGVSQVLPVIVALHYAPEGSTVLLEQPEIHLHPLAQAELADVIIHAATHRNLQIVLESHSEHLLLRLQRRIAEAERINAGDVALYFCESRDGASGIEALDLDEYGNIRNWPDKFMGDAFHETAHAELARLERMKKAAG